MPAPTSATLNRKWNCRLTTTGRKSKQPRTVTLWFVLDGDMLFLTGGKQMPQWCRNIRANGAVSIEIAGTTLHGDAQMVENPAEGSAIIDRFLRKYLLARLSRPFGGYRNSVAVIVRLKQGTSP